MTLGLFLSGDIMVFDFLHFVFFPTTIRSLLLRTFCRKITKKFLHIFLWKSLTEMRIRRLELSVLR